MPGVNASIEKQVDLSDWDEFGRVTYLANHWWDRPGWQPDRHYLTWYLLFDSHDLRAYVARFQAALADLDYLDPVPADDLHLTVQGVDFADLVDEAEVAAIASEAKRRCRGLVPFSLTIGPINAYPGGTFLRAKPWKPVQELRDRLRAAIAAVRGHHAVPDEPARFKPHISVAYCHAKTDARQLRQRLAVLREIPPLSITVDQVALLELRREHHVYRWDVRGVINLAGKHGGALP